MIYILILSVLKVILSQKNIELAERASKNIEYVITCQILPTCIFCKLWQMFLQILKVNAFAQLTIEFFFLENIIDFAVTFCRYQFSMYSIVK